MYTLRARGGGVRKAARDGPALDDEALLPSAPASNASRTVKPTPMAAHWTKMKPSTDVSSITHSTNGWSNSVSAQNR